MAPSEADLRNERRHWIPPARIDGASPCPRQGYHATSLSLSTRRLFRIAIPDCHFTIDVLVGDGDMVSLSYTFAGAHTGPLRDVAATGEQCRFEVSRSPDSWMARASRST
ncbi:MAG: hypothetical protein EA421_09395 [Gemmatimonadales bacterium]|nr:MAG: hypothetical protein EA421_09395 [Gemmatimonadales bacterium]